MYTRKCAQAQNNVTNVKWVGREEVGGETVLKTIMPGRPVAQSVEWAPVTRGCVLAAAAAGSVPHCGPLLHVISSPFFPV